MSWRASLAEGGSLTRRFVGVALVILTYAILSGCQEVSIKKLVPRLAKSDELVLHATYHGSDVYDGCHSIFDKFIGGRYQ
jgi:hypothetical protein